MIWVMLADYFANSFFCIQISYCYRIKAAIQFWAFVANIDIYFEIFKTYGGSSVSELMHKVDIRVKTFADDHFKTS